MQCTAMRIGNISRIQQQQQEQKKAERANNNGSQRLHTLEKKIVTQ